MKPVLGQNRDSDFSVGNKNKISDGKNFIITDRFSKVTSELGNKLLSTLSGIIIGNIPTSDSFVLFSIDGIFSEIGIYANDTYTIILKTQYLNFNINHPIFGEYMINQKGEIIVIFSDDTVDSKILNINDLPFEIDNNYELVKPAEIVLIQQFVPFKSPIFVLKNVNNSGGNLKSGVYYISIQYKLHDGTYTNNSDLSNPIVIVKSSYKEIWENFNGDYEEINTNKHIELNIHNIDVLFKQYKVNIIHKSLNGITAYTYRDFNIVGNNNIVISDIDNLQQIDINSILVPSMIFSTIGTFTKLNNRLYLAKLSIASKLKYQKYANNITSSWVYNSQVSLDGIKGSYKDSFVIYNNKGFMPGEIVALYIRFINKNSNVKSPAFHIPGRDGTTTELAQSINNEVLKVYNNAKVYQMEDTCSIIDSANGIGQMGFWQNENEYYPSNSIDKDNDFDGGYDYNLNPITGGRNLQNTLVKHHKLPSLNYLANALSNKSIINAFNNVANYNYVKFTSPLASYDVYKTTANATFVDDSNEGVFPTSNIWLNNTGKDLSITLDYNLSILVSNLSIDLTTTVEAYINIYVLKADGTTVYIDGVSISPQYNDIDLTLVNNKVITVNNGDSIKITMYAHTTSTKWIVSFDGYCNGGYGGIPEVSGSTFGRILAIKLDNIYIPDYVKSDYTHFEILYAERTADNMTVLANSVLPYRTDFKDSNRKKYDRYYSFDLLYSKLGLNPTHIRLDYSLNNNIPIADTNAVITPFSMQSSIKSLVSAKYVMNNDSSADPNNAINEEYIQLKYNTPPVDLLTTTDYLIATMYEFKTDVYTSFTNQKLVRTGNILAISDFINTTTNIVTTDIIYGGDTYFNLHGLTLINRNIDIATNTVKDIVGYMLMPEYSISNIGLRYMTKDIYTLFFPKYNLIDNVNSKGISYNNYYINKKDISGTSYSGNVNALPYYDSIFTTIVKALGEYKNKDFELFNVSPYYGYNKIYNSVNDITPFIIFDPTDIFISKLDNTVYRTVVQPSESFELDWRTILPNEYVISGIDRDEIVKLDTYGLELLVEHKFGTFVYKYRGELNISNNVVTELGDADIFKQDPFELIPDGIGYVGCQSKFASITTKFGNIIVDRSQGKVFIYNGKVLEISNFMMREFFIHNLQYDNSAIVSGSYLFNNSYNVLFDNGATIDIGSTSKEVNLAVDNPYGGLGIVCAWDEEYERLILTKVSSTTDSFSIDYYPAINSWGFFHTFIPTQIFNNRNGLFAILQNNILKLNSNAPGLFILDNTNTYVNVKSYIDIVFTKNIVFSKSFKSIFWKTIVMDYISNTVNDNKTFDSIIIFSYNKYSNPIDLVLQTFDSGNVRNTGKLWKFNKFRNILLNKNIEIIDKLKVDELQINVLTGTDIASVWSDKSLFIDDFVIVRFIFNNTNNEGISLTDVFINSNTIER